MPQTPISEQRFYGEMRWNQCKKVVCVQGRIVNTEFVLSEDIVFGILKVAKAFALLLTQATCDVNTFMVSKLPR